MILAMQGSWTSQSHHSWQVVNSLYEESCPGPVHMWRPNTDGTRRLMTRTDMLTNRTMFLIGRIALDKEHLLLWQLLYRLKQIPRAPTVHGCTNGWLYVRPVDETEEELANRITTQVFRTNCSVSRMTSQSSNWKSKEVEHVDDAGHTTIQIGDEDHLVLFDAPANNHTWKRAAAKPSRWSCMPDNFQDERMKEKDQLKEEYTIWPLVSRWCILL